MSQASFDSEMLMSQEACTQGSPSLLAPKKQSAVARDALGESRRQLLFASSQKRKIAATRLEENVHDSESSDVETDDICAATRSRRFAVPVAVLKAQVQAAAASASQDENPRAKRSRVAKLANEALESAFDGMSFMSQEPVAASPVTPAAPKRLSGAGIVVPSKEKIYVDVDSPLMRKLAMDNPLAAAASQESSSFDSGFRLVPVTFEPAPGSIATSSSSQLRTLVVPGLINPVLGHKLTLGRCSDTGIVDRRVSRAQAVIFFDNRSDSLMIQNCATKPTLVFRGGDDQEHAITVAQDDAIPLQVGDVIELLRNRVAYKVFDLMPQAEADDQEEEDDDDEAEDADIGIDGVPERRRLSR